MFKSFRKKGKNGKRGSMLTLVLVIVAMGLIFVTSAIMITNSTRMRYYDNVLTGQARLVSTAVAESFCSALAIQEISDDNLETWCGDGGSQATVTLNNVPGLGKGGTETLVTFDSDGSYLLATFSTTIGTKADGNFATENCTVYFKAKSPKKKVDRFKNLLEVGLSADMGGFNIGYGHDHGSTNTCFFHGNTTMTETAGNNVYSDVIVTGDTAFGNDTKIEGSFIFAGPDAHIPKFTGSLEAENVFFVSPDGYAKGSVASSDAGASGYVDIKNWSNTLLYNFELNKRLGQNGEAGNYINQGGGASVNSTIVNWENGYYNSHVKPSWENVSDDYVNKDKAMQKLFDDYVKSRAEAALSAEQAYPLTDAQVTAEKETFLDNVDDSYKKIAQKCIDTKSKAAGALNMNQLSAGKAGVYYADTFTIDKEKSIDLNGENGPFILIIGKSLRFGAEKAHLKVTNNDPTDDSKWLRIILLDGASIDIGQGCSGYDAGIITAQDVVIDSKTYQKANAYIYGGNDTHLNFTGDHKACEAYVGLYGPKSSISVQGIQESVIGRWECSNITTLKANGTSLPWSPMPTDGSSNDKWKAKESNYEIVRFRYYY